MKGTFLLAIFMSAIHLGLADSFGTGANQFTIEFVTISGDASSANGTNITQFSEGHSHYLEFTDPGDFRIGKYEISNAQWMAFKQEYGTVTGARWHNISPYDDDPYFTGDAIPTNNVSWYEAAQFINWLNTSTGHQAAYNFIGTQGTADYTLGIWDARNAAGGTNFYRHKDAFYYLPTDHEWVKAAYWNGTNLQAYAIKAGESLSQGDGVSGTGWNFYDGDYVFNPYRPWVVTQGSEELNGTKNMMGNISEWMESSYDGGYQFDVARNLRAGYYWKDDTLLVSSYCEVTAPYVENRSLGFRVASVPEPATVMLLGLGVLTLTKRQRGATCS